MPLNLPLQPLIDTFFIWLKTFKPHECLLQKFMYLLYFKNKFIGCFDFISFEEVYRCPILVAGNQTFCFHKQYFRKFKVVFFIFASKDLLNDRL